MAILLLKVDARSLEDDFHCLAFEEVGYFRVELL